MTSRNVQLLTAVVVGLLFLVFVLNTGDDDTTTGRTPFLPGFAAQAGKVDRIQIPRAPGETGMTIRRHNDRWALSTRDGYPADVSKLAALVTALAEASVIEEKTSNPELYERLGLDDPEDGGSGIKVVISGEGFAWPIILGDSAQGNYRYARVADKPGSYLIDRNPDVPTDFPDWLDADIIDIGADSIRRVTITHADGETIVVEKDTQEQSDFTVLDVPEGRELSYASVGNGIGGALANLDLDDVRASRNGDIGSTVAFETWDGATITATVVNDADVAWVSFAAEPNVDGLNEIVTGWQYRLPEFKSNLLSRRWEDLLKAEDAGDAGDEQP